MVFLEAIKENGKARLPEWDESHFVLWSDPYKHYVYWKKDLNWWLPSFEDGIRDDWEVSFFN